MKYIRIGFGWKSGLFIHRSEHSTHRAGGIMKPPGRGQETSQGRKPLVCSGFKPSPGGATEDSYLIAICRPSGARLFLYPYRGLTPPACCASRPFRAFHLISRLSNAVTAEPMRVAPPEVVVYHNENNFSGFQANHHAAQASVPRFPHFSHTTGADGGEDFVWAEFDSW